MNQAIISLVVLDGKGGTPPPVPIPVEPPQEIPRPLTPMTPVDWGFCDPSAHLCCSPRPLDVFHDGRNTSAASTSSRGKSNILRKLLLKRMADLNKITAKKVNEDTDLEKVKLLFTRTVPKVEKAVCKFENTLQMYSRLADPDDLDNLTVQVEAATVEATRFMDTVGMLYDENEGYAPGLSGYEKATTDIKPFSAGSDVTIFKFLEKFSAYFAGTKKVKAYKLYNNYLSASIQAQTASFQQNYDELIRFLTTTYGKIEVISGGLLTELEKQKKPADTDYQKRAESLFAIANVILRIRNLKTKLPEEQVTAEITSYNFLHRIRNLLSTWSSPRT